MLTLSLFSLASAATWANRLGVDDLRTAADQIVLGEVSAVTSRRVPGGIVTDVTISVTETLLGTPEPALTLTLPGGSLASESLTVSGVPRLLSGHDLLLFLDDGQPVGFTQGILFLDGPQVFSPVWESEASVSLEEIRKAVR